VSLSSSPALRASAFSSQYLIKGRRTGRTFPLGDPVRIKVIRINAFRSEIDLELISAG